MVWTGDRSALNEELDMVNKMFYSTEEFRFTSAETAQSIGKAYNFHISFLYISGHRLMMVRVSMVPQMIRWTTINGVIGTMEQILVMTYKPSWTIGIRNWFRVGTHTLSTMLQKNKITNYHLMINMLSKQYMIPHRQDLKFRLLRLLLIFWWCRIGTSTWPQTQ